MSFVKIIGFDPMIIIDKRAKDDEEKRFQSPLRERIVYEKRKMLEDVLIRGESS